MSRSSEVRVLASAVAWVVAMASVPSSASAQDESRSRRDEADACPPYSLGCFLDASRTWRRAEAAYARLVPTERHYLRAAGEDLLFVLGGAAWYYLDDDNHLRQSRPPWRTRFQRGVVCFDNNEFWINFVGHPLSGAAYYAFPRANGLSFPAAATYAIVSSSIWEYVLEIRGHVSLNDLITTPIAGIAIGEFFARLGRYLNRAPGGGRPIHRAFGWTLGVGQAVHDAMDDVPPLPADTPTDALGYDASIAHHFEWSNGYAHARFGGAGATSSALYEAALAGRLVALPSHLRPGKVVEYFGDANVTRLALRVGAGPDGRSVELEADTVMLGLHAQRIRERARGSLRGASAIVGSSVGYGYRRDAFDAFEDRVATTRLPGAAVDVDALFGRVGLHVGARLHGEFGGIHSAPYEAWRQAHPDARAKSILEREGYYFGWGLGGRTTFRLDSPHLSIGGDVALARYASQEGFDTSQEELTADVSASDRVLDAALWVRLHPAGWLGFFLELGASRYERWSRIESSVVERRADALRVRIGQVF